MEEDSKVCAPFRVMSVRKGFRQVTSVSRSAVPPQSSDNGKWKVSKEGINIFQAVFQ